MFLVRLFHDPHNNIGVLSGGIGDDLAEMVMVRSLELILDDNRPAGGGISGENIKPILADLRFSLNRLKIDPDRFGKQLHVFRRSQPLRDIISLVPPNLAKWNSFQHAQFHTVSFC